MLTAFAAAIDEDAVLAGHPDVGPAVRPGTAFSALRAAERVETPPVPQKAEDVDDETDEHTGEVCPGGNLAQETHGIYLLKRIVVKETGREQV